VNSGLYGSATNKLFTTGRSGLKLYINENKREIIFKSKHMHNNESNFNEINYAHKIDIINRRSAPP